MANKIDEAVSRMTAWQRDYGEKCSPQFNHDLKELIGAGRERSMLREACMFALSALRDAPMVLGDYAIDPHVRGNVAKCLLDALTTPGAQSKPVQDATAS